MEPLTIQTFKPDLIKAVNYEQKKAGEINYISVKFEYNGGAMPPLRIDGKFRLFRFKNHRGDIYSLSIRCDKDNKPFFRRLCDAVARKFGRLVPKVNGKKLKPEDFDLVKDSKSGRSVNAKIYSRRSEKAKCRIFLGSPKNTIKVEELVDENFDESCIVKLYHSYMGSTRSITLSVEEIFAKEMATMESYFDESDSKESEEEDE